MSETKTITTVDDIKRRLRQKAGAVGELLNNPMGKALIDALEQEFYHGELKGADPYETYYNMGRRDVVVYLHQLRRLNERENDNGIGTT